MSIDYTFEVESVFRKHLLEEAVASAGLQRSEVEKEAWLSHGLNASINGIGNRYGQYLDAFGFDPKLMIFFSVDKFEYDIGVVKMVDIVAAALSSFPDDAVFVENHDTPLLLRRDGVVILTDRTDFWAPGALPLLDRMPPPYQWAALPVF